MIRKQFSVTLLRRNRGDDSTSCQAQKETRHAIFIHDPDGDGDLDLVHFNYGHAGNDVPTVITTIENGEDTANMFAAPKTADWLNSLIY